MPSGRRSAGWTGTKWPSKAGSGPPTAPSPAGRARAAPAFWAVTIKADEAMPTGYGVNAHAVVIRYAQRDIPLASATDGFSAVRTEFGPGCKELLLRASGAEPAFVYEPLPPHEAEVVVATYLIDAALSLAEGRGPLLIIR